MVLFGMEYKKIAKSILYWVLVLALLAVSCFQYEPSVESELQRTDDPASVFYTTSSGSYAEERNYGPNEATERAMMVGATKRLINNYRSNRYEYYPFGYVKEKTMSEQEQAMILQYLMELTGLSEQAVNGEAGGADDPGFSNDAAFPKQSEQSNGNIGDIPISGPGAFVIEPGQGGTYENGQFVIEPDDWQYVPDDGVFSETPESPGRDEKHPASSGSFVIQVSFERFKEIMESINRMIGRNSYFSWTMLTFYYFGNDCEDAPITERQHREFYEGDRVTGAFARYYCDCISQAVLFLPAFVIVDLMLRDKRRKMQGLTYPRTISSAKLICTRYAAAVCMVMLPILVLPVRSLFLLMRYCGSIGVQADVLAFVKYTLAWILPTVLLMMAINLLVTVLLENYTAILLTGLLWLIGRPGVDKIAGGNYGLFDLIIRHNTLKSYGRMMENIHMLVWNRAAISVAALALVGASILVYGIKRKGGLRFEGRKPAHDHRFKSSPEC